MKKRDSAIWNCKPSSRFTVWAGERRSQHGTFYFGRQLSLSPPLPLCKRRPFPGELVGEFTGKQSRLVFYFLFFDFGRTKRYSVYHQSKLVWVVARWPCTCCTFSTFRGLRMPKATSKGWVIISVSVGKKKVTYFHYKTTPFWVFSILKNLN